MAQVQSGLGSVLSGIANPAIANIPGVLAGNEQRVQRAAAEVRAGNADQRAQNKETRTQETHDLDKDAAEKVTAIIGSTTAGRLAIAAGGNARDMIATAGRLGLDVAPEAQYGHFVQSINMFRTTIKTAGPKAALALFMEQRQTIQAQVKAGLLPPSATKLYDQVIDGFSQGATPDKGIEAVELMYNMFAEQGQYGDSAKYSGKTEILENGDIITVNNKGEQELNGEVATPEEIRAAVAAGQLQGSDDQGERAAKRAATTAATKRSENAFTAVENIRTDIRTIDEALAEIDSGADSGPISRYFPSIKAASVKLDNLQGRLGLNVLKTTTFGALSASELDFALSTALPTGLQPEELREWLTKKRDAQNKLADYYTEVAHYFGTPGNTVAKWIEKKEIEEFQRNRDTQSPEGNSLDYMSMLPEGTKDNGDGTFTLADGQIVEPE